jgi:hypothetical protein
MQLDQTSALARVSSRRDRITRVLRDVNDSLFRGREHEEQRERWATVSLASIGAWEERPPSPDLGLEPSPYHDVTQDLSARMEEASDLLDDLLLREPPAALAEAVASEINSWNKAILAALFREHASKPAEVHTPAGGQRPLRPAVRSPSAPAGRGSRISRTARGNAPSTSRVARRFGTTTVTARGFACHFHLYKPEKYRVQHEIGSTGELYRSCMGPGWRELRHLRY